jgi:hypothetical protein
MGDLSKPIKGKVIGMKKIFLIFVISLFFGCAHMNQNDRNFMSSRVDPDSISDERKFYDDNGLCCDWTGNIRSYIIFADAVPAFVYYDGCMRRKGYRILGDPK